MRGDRIILICLYFLPVILGSTDKNETRFVPTHEWQIVKKGTPIPGGLHIRHNFETGITEAKLMDPKSDEESTDEKSKNSQSLTLHPDKSILHDDNEDSIKVTQKPNPVGYQIDELKARLKKIRQEEIELIPNLDDENSQEEVKNKFRDYETIKKELKALEVNITTDPELITTYFQKFEFHKDGVIAGTLSVLEIKEVMDILDNLAFLVSYIDNAKVFTDMQGMTKIINPCLNGTNNDIKAEGLRVLGTAVQSNPKVQIKAVENDFVHKLLHILSTNGKVEVKSRCLFALSALIRQFPIAQKVWIDHGGLDVFAKILVNSQLNIQIKIMKLINDLLIERQNLQEISDVEQRQQRIKAYAAADVESKLIVHDYCSHLNNCITKTFKEQFNNEFGSENYEYFEVISESMINVFPICKSVFRRNRDTLLPILNQLLEFYNILNSSSDEEGYDISSVLSVLMKKVESTISDLPHDEL